MRPAKQRLTGLGAAFRKLAPHFRGFVREQPKQDRRDGGTGARRCGWATRVRDSMKYMLDTSICIYAMLGGSGLADGQ